MSRSPPMNSRSDSQADIGRFDCSEQRDSVLYCGGKRPVHVGRDRYGNLYH